jgi:putative transposase
VILLLCSWHQIIRETLRCNVSTTINMEKFLNKYRIPSARLVGWDYSNEGAYFITICTQGKKHFFGECIEGKMKLTTAGAIAQGFWYEIPKHFPNVELGEFVVMPNHIHGILMLHTVETLHRNVSSAEDNTPSSPEQTTISCEKETLRCNVSTGAFFQKISPKSGSIATIVRSYKSICTKHIHQTFPAMNFEWQTRFWDNIIKDDRSFETITHYIINNPHNWHRDCFSTP